MVEAKQVRDDTQIAMRQTRGMIFQGRKVTAGVLKDAQYLRTMLRTDAAVKFLKNVRGSPAYWQRVLYDVLAMVRQLGVPTWFLTLSAADMQWPEIIQSIAHQHGKVYTNDEIAAMAWEEKSMWLRTNPVTAARQFQYRLDTFFKEFICGQANPIGDVQDYFIRIEFQARGSPHAHTIIWVNNAPRLGTHTEEQITHFIDTYQSCEVTEDSTRFQMHKHSATCRRNGTCRFHFPQKF